MTCDIPLTTPVAWLLVDGLGTRNRRLTAVRFDGEDPMLWFPSVTDAIRHCLELGLTQLAAYIDGRPWTITLTPELSPGDDADDSTAA